MGKSSSQPQTMQLPSQNTTTTQLPKWVEDAARANYDAAANINPAAFAPYSGTRVEGLNDQQLGLINGLIGNVGSGNAGYQNAQNAVSNALSGLGGLKDYTPANVAYGNFNPSKLAQYFNPYTSEVIDTSMKLMDEKKAGALNSNADMAAKQSAFGSSRRNIMDAVTDAQYGMNAASLAANLRNQGYTQAMDAYGTDRARAMQADLANQSSGLTAANMNNQMALDRARAGLTGAGLMGTLNAQQQADYLSSAQAGLGAANQIYNNKQAIADAGQQWSKDFQNSMIAPINLRMQALGMTPYNTTTTSSGFTSKMYEPTSESPFMSALGSLGKIGSMFASPAGGTSAAAGLGSALGTGLSAAGSGLGSILGSLGMSFLPVLSDKSMKTDIEKLGKDSESGMDMYAYRYKGDPKSYPKVVGPMAQDIQARNPSGVKSIGGKLVVKGLL